MARSVDQVYDLLVEVKTSVVQIQDKLAEVSGRLDDHSETLYGNGTDENPGLKLQVDRIANACKRNHTGRLQEVCLDVAKGLLIAAVTAIGTFFLVIYKLHS